MMISGGHVKCLPCKRLLKYLRKTDTLKCLKCGEKDSQDQVMREVGWYLYDIGAIGPSLKKKPREKRELRFYVDINDNCNSVT